MAAQFLLTRRQQDGGVPHNCLVLSLPEKKITKTENAVIWGGGSVARGKTQSWDFFLQSKTVPDM